MPKVILASQSSQDSSNIAANPERLLNLLAERMNQGSKTILTLRAVPGQVAFGEVGAILIRDIKEVDGVLYVVASSQLFSVAANGSYSSLGAIVDDESTVIDGNGHSVTVSAGGNYYVWDGSTLSQPIGGLLTSIGSVGFSGQYTVMTEKDGNRFEWSTLADPETRNALHFATCESNNDNVLRVVPHMNYIWLFNQESTEIWYNTGASGANAFAPLAGGTSDVGLKAVKLAVRFDGGIFFVGNDGVAYLAGGNGLLPISSPAVETALDVGAATNCFYYEYRGHKICVIRFSDRPAWCYDFTTQMWHERSSGVSHSGWESVGTAFAYSKWVAGTILGKVNEISGSSDVNEPLRRTLVSRPFHIGPRFTASEFELYGGFGDQDVTYYDDFASELLDDSGDVITDDSGETIYTGAYTTRSPVVMAQFSKDGGRTWRGEKTRATGKVGERRKRVRFNGLGSYFNLAVKVSITDDVDIPLYSEANLEIL